MPRWRQHFNKETQKSEFIPIDDAAREADGIAVHGAIEPFVSPIDGTVISGRKQYREHCKRHNVVPTEDFGTDYWNRKAKEREAIATGTARTRQEELKDKQKMYEHMMRLERNGR